MRKPIGPRKVHRYSAEFELTAVKFSRMPGVQVQTVAEALDIHPFMLSRWRKEARDGILRGRVKGVDGTARPAREIKRLQVLEREHAMLQEEHELLKNQSGTAPTVPPVRRETGNAAMLIGALEAVAVSFMVTSRAR